MNAPFAVFAGALALVAAAMSVTRTNAVHALLNLLAALLALAAAFFALGAGFAAALQILVYAGAIVVLFVFVVMTVDPAAARARYPGVAEGWPLPAAIAALIAAPVLFGLGAIAPGAAASVSAEIVGRLLFGPWALAIELASMLLLAGLLGVRHIGRRDQARRSR